MFHELNPSGLSLASQRLKVLRQERPFSERSGVELVLTLAGGKLERLDFTLTGAAAGDDFYLAFFTAYRSLFEKKNIWQLAGLGFREWESYWRDRNHLELFQNTELAAARLLYQETLNLFLNELWGQMWPATTYPSTAPWAQRLAWMKVSAQQFFGPEVRLAEWPARACNETPLDLVLLMKTPPQLASEVFLALEQFWRERIPAIKALKLVAEHALER